MLLKSSLKVEMLPYLILKVNYDPGSEGGHVVQEAAFCQTDFQITFSAAQPVFNTHHFWKGGSQGRYSPGKQKRFSSSSFGFSSEVTVQAVIHIGIDTLN